MKPAIHGYWHRGLNKSDNGRPIRKNILAIGYQDSAGTIVVTDVLTNRMPVLSERELAELSAALERRILR